MNRNARSPHHAQRPPRPLRAVMGKRDSQGGTLSAVLKRGALAGAPRRLGVRSLRHRFSGAAGFQGALRLPPRFKTWRAFERFPRRAAFPAASWVLLFSVLLTLPLAARPSTNVLPPLLPPYGPLPPTFWQQHRATLIASGVALGLLITLVLWSWCRPKPQPPTPPDIEARAALRRFLDRPEDGSGLDDIVQILRRYVIRAFEFPAGQFTTVELCHQLQRSGPIGPELAGALEAFLRECDRRRFAPETEPPPLDAARRALQLVGLAEEHRARLAGPPPTSDAQRV